MYIYIYAFLIKQDTHTEARTQRTRGGRPPLGVGSTISYWRLAMRIFDFLSSRICICVYIQYTPRYMLVYLSICSTFDVV